MSFFFVVVFVVFLSYAYWAITYKTFERCFLLLLLFLRIMVVLGQHSDFPLKASSDQRTLWVSHQQEESSDLSITLNLSSTVIFLSSTYISLHVPDNHPSPLSFTMSSK